ncbi:dynein light chain [Plasmodium brasilianum]|uniref:Dynein light chain n=2 Tax=Plasmodium (Plasmodium) TaxID=418103 RepID=A0A1A8WTA0_PLAMA|nr:dynein light chain, putative [Plasmodium malariae]KAI4837151.1 dynein light chain [Plasmodium brasilianum]SBS94561.1 dynein light chain, putative [Plasmodium malariae]SCO93036.1 dynein light chain, putative [Plasmodium malariae]
MEQTEVKKYLSKFEIKGICMNSENSEKIFKISLKAIKENKYEKDIASQIKMKCENDELLNKEILNDENNLNMIDNLKNENIGSWQCIVGKNFAFSINYQFNCMIYFKHKSSKLTILIYKSM